MKTINEPKVLYYNEFCFNFRAQVMRTRFGDFSFLLSEEKDGEDSPILQWELPVPTKDKSVEKRTKIGGERGLNIRVCLSGNIGIFQVSKAGREIVFDNFALDGTEI